MNSQLLWQWMFVDYPPCEGVNDCLLDNCQISSLPRDCVVFVKCEPKSSQSKEPKTLTTSVCVHWIYFTHVFHNLSWITEINELFREILIYWDAPVKRCCTECAQRYVFLWDQVALKVKHTNTPPLLSPPKYSLLSVDGKLADLIKFLSFIMSLSYIQII